MNLKHIGMLFSVCKVEDYTEINLGDEYIFTASTPEEKSLVCPTNVVPKRTVEREDGWKAFKIEGILDFSLIGILAKIANILSENKISIFAVSTYNTDYVLIKEEFYDRATVVLIEHGYEFI